MVEITETRKFEILRMSHYELMHTDMTEAELRLAAEQRGYKPGWVYKRMQEMGKR